MKVMKVLILLMLRFDAFVRIFVSSAAFLLLILLVVVLLALGFQTWSLPLVGQRSTT